MLLHFHTRNCQNTYRLEKVAGSERFKGMDEPNSQEDTLGSSAAAQPVAAHGTIKFPKIIAFNDLCRCGDEVWIENEGQIYRLRRTKLGRLILTK